MHRARFVTAGIAPAVVTVDQLTKAAATRSWRNDGYAFGVVGGSRPVLVAVAAAVLAGFLVLALRYGARLGVPPWIAAVVVAASASNVVDRVLLGSVRDWIVTPWAILNAADLVVVAGLFGLGACALRATRPRFAGAHPIARA